VRPGGAVMLEIGAWQAADVRKLALAAFPAAQVMVQQDLAGRDRVVLIEGV
jgi:release factor glutamine methyltransferase